MVSPPESASVWVGVVTEAQVAVAQPLSGLFYAPCTPPGPCVADVLGSSLRR